MTSLTRTSSSGYDLNQAVDLETIEAEVDTPEKWLQPIDSFLLNYLNFNFRRINLSGSQTVQVSI